ncbi:phosphotransferase [Cognatishimia sp. SS12]|uniref:aminoglycoside phosphotransferase family protein n=1 Tax=Cognatishimia sp. SS12 TaxID=2979465 RepID=UPI00232ED8AA|nr:phosphotransferase [Cognatishimia sp. SS12]MDC0737760.1 phosphotransferase [Cognatishimia sp. SS12]
MSDRNSKILDFMAATEWRDARRLPLAGDASNRRYDRLHRADGTTAVLMDAPPEKGEDVRPFVRIADHLRALGLSPPKILAADATHGLLLIEDLGDDLFARVLEHRPESESQLYGAAIDVLCDLHDTPPPSDLPTYAPKLMAELASLPWLWYAPDAEMRAEFQAIFEPILAQNVPEADVLIQRDYHAENLLWLPGQQGSARVGLLDFQDAMAGHRAYDLVSLLQDARRDVSLTTEADMIRRYVAQTGVDPASFDTAYHLLGAQRNLRILGVFARLCLRDGKAHYVDLIPRVWGYLMRDLTHPVLAEIAPLVQRTLPAPTPSYLQRLKEKCATIQKP